MQAKENNVAKAAYLQAMKTTLETQPQLFTTQSPSDMHHLLTMDALSELDAFSVNTKTGQHAIKYAYDMTAPHAKAAIDTALNKEGIHLQTNHEHTPQQEVSHAKRLSHR